jgi:hypothetical protein
VLTAEQPSGLIISPSGKKTRTLLVETWKKLLRLQRECKAEGMKTVASCADCGERITMTVPSKTTPQLECRCTTWIGR